MVFNGRLNDGVQLLVLGHHVTEECLDSELCRVLAVGLLTSIGCWPFQNLLHLRIDPCFQVSLEVSKIVKPLGRFSCGWQHLVADNTVFQLHPASKGFLPAILFLCNVQGSVKFLVHYGCVIHQTFPTQCNEVTLEALEGLADAYLAQKNVLDVADIVHPLLIHSHGELAATNLAGRSQIDLQSNTGLPSRLNFAKLLAEVLLHS